ncbi:MAG: hypothetical protein ABI609_04415 [Acidobacteriota bacterium]
MTAIALLLAGALASWFCSLHLPLPPADPLRDTLVMLPFLAASFSALHSWGLSLGARAIPRRLRVAETAALLGLALLTLARPGLEVLAPEVLAGAFALLLLHRLARQTLALRPLLGSTLPARPSPIFLALPFLAYLAILPYSAGQHPPDGDEPYYLLITHSLAYDGDAELTNNYRDGSWKAFSPRALEPQPGDPHGPSGEIYSRHNELLPMFLVPFYRVAGKTGAQLAMALLTAAVAWLLLRLARRWYANLPGEALFAYALVAFSPPLLLYSYQIWVEVPATLLGLFALDRVLAPQEPGSTGWSTKRWLGVGLPVILLPLLKIRFVILAAPLLVLAWLFAGRPRRPVLVLTGVLVLVAGGMMLYNATHFGNPLKIHTWDEVEFYHQNPARHLLGFLGLFWDAGFGLFACAPIWLLVLPALVLLARERHPLVLALAITTLPYLILVAPRSEWYGGWSPPFRYGLVLLPFLGLSLVPLLAARRHFGARALLGALGALTLVLTLLWLVVPGWTYNFADGRTYLLDAMSAHFHADVARIFPSGVRPRLAMWLWPLLTLPLVPWFWSLGRHRRARFARGGATLGIAGLLALVCALPAIAQHFASRSIEFEDPWVIKSGGHLEPERWRVDRTLFRGGWMLRGGESLRVPVVPGGTRLEVDVDLEWVRNQPSSIALEARQNGRLLATWTPPRAGTWETAALGPFAFEAGHDLEFLAVGAAAEQPLGGLLLDRARLHWR